MTEINLFPIQVGNEAVKRITAKLKSDFEAGEDLGSRVAHIHALAETLERTLVVLDREVDGLRATLSPNEADVLLRDSGLDTTRTQLRSLIQNARSFSRLD
jgi:hypothetical protein